MGVKSLVAYLANMPTNFVMVAFNVNFEMNFGLENSIALVTRQRKTLARQSVAFFSMPAKRRSPAELEAAFWAAAAAGRGGRIVGRQMLFEAVKSGEMLFAYHT